MAIFSLGLICQECFKMLQERSFIPVSMAKIEVQRNFCNSCSKEIREELEQIEGIKNLRLYPKDLLITFNFRKAQHLSAILNRLSVIGYPEKGEMLCSEVCTNSVCKC